MRKISSKNLQWITDKKNNRKQIAVINIGNDIYRIKHIRGTNYFYARIIKNKSTAFNTFDDDFKMERPFESLRSVVIWLNKKAIRTSILQTLK